jgi:cupin 2 domain-containing protein
MNPGICKNNILKLNKLPGKIDVELFEELFKSKNSHIERIISVGWNKVEDNRYDQETEEWVLLIKGSASIEFENNYFIEMIEGDYIFIPSHCKHKVIKTSSNPPCIWLAVHFTNLE